MRHYTSKIAASNPDEQNRDLQPTAHRAFRLRSAMAGQAGGGAGALALGACFRMTQRMPVVRQLHWIGLIPQFIAIAVLAAIAYVAYPNLGVPFDIFIAALAYLIFCRLMRAKFVRDHRSGMRAYHAQKFQEAISHFEASYLFFSAHRRLDT